MCFRKTYSLILITFILCTLSTFANAQDAIFKNNSKYTLSFSKYMNVCSTELGNIASYSEKNISDANLTQACQPNPSECYIKVYSGANCDGKYQALLEFKNTKLIHVGYPTSGTNFSIGYNGYTIYFNGMS